MTLPSTRLAALLTTLMFVLAACSGSAASPSAAASSVASVAASSAPASESAAASSAAASSAPASESASAAASESASASTAGGPSANPSLGGGSHQAPDLEAQLPDKVGTETLQKLSVKGESVFTSGGSTSAAVQAALASIGKSINDVSFALAGGEGVQVGVYKVNGADANNVLTLLLQASKQGGGAFGDVTDTNKGGKAVKLAKATAATGNDIYFYPHGDTLFFAGGDNDAAVTEALSKLP